MARRNPLDLARFVRVSALADRLERAGCELALSLSVWSVLCALLLPERFVGVAPARPSRYEPGSPEKIGVMVARVRRGELPLHPKDAADPNFVESADTHDKEQRATGRRRDNLGKTPGVKFSRGKWRAVLREGGRRHDPGADLGTFDTYEEAAEAIEEARRLRSAASELRG